MQLFYDLIFNDMLMSIVLQSETTIDSQITTWGETVKKVMNAATAVFAIVGGFLIFFQYMQGNDQAQKNFIKFVIGLAIVGLVNLIVVFFIPDASGSSGSGSDSDSGSDADSDTSSIHIYLEDPTTEELVIDHFSTDYSKYHIDPTYLLGRKKSQKS